MVNFANRVKVTTATTGTANVVLGSAVEGFQTFAQGGITNGQTVRYVIEEGAAFEIGTGTYTATGTILSRDTVIESSNSGAKISLQGDAKVFIALAADDFLPVGGGTMSGAITFVAGQTFDGRDVSVDGAKLDTIESGAEVNDPAFKTISVSGQTNIVADADADTLTLIAGTGISIATNASTDAITFTNSAPDQTVSLTGGSNVTITGSYPNFTISSTDTNTNKLTTFVLEDGDGTEVIIGDSKEVKFVEGGGVDINWTNTANGTDLDPYDLTFTINTGVTAGNGLTGGGTLNATRTIHVGAGAGISVTADAVAHADTSTQASVNNSGNTVIQDITLDGFGHVTGLASTTLSIPAAIPSGVIVMWSGAVSAIPSGWVICDGLNGTPNLTDRFVIHADADTGGTRNVGATGGANTVTLATGNLPSHTHSFSANATSGASGSHGHTFTGTAVGNHTHGVGTYAVGSGGGHTPSGTLDTGGAHTHGVGTLAAGDAGGHGHTFTGTAVGNHTHGAGNFATASAGDHSHNFNANTGNSGNHTHNGATSNTGAHTHTFSLSKSGPGNGDRTLEANNNSLSGSGTTSSAGAHSHNFTTAGGGDHSHNFNANTGTTGAHTHTFTGSTGGAGAHTPAGTIDSVADHTHALSGATASGGGHTHTFTGDEVAAHTHTLSGASAGAGAHTPAGTISNAANHTHSVSVSGTTGSAGSGTAITITPKFYALAFIMKT